MNWPIYLLLAPNQIWFIEQIEYELINSFKTNDNNERNILWDIYGVMFESYVAIKMKQMIVSYC